MGNVPLLTGGFLRDWTERLRNLAGPPVIGVLLRGSHARGEATRCSDVDLDVLVSGGSHVGYPAFLAPLDGRLVHLSVAVRDVGSWLDRLYLPAEWSFGLPVVTPARLLWASDEWRSRLDLPRICQPPAAPQLEEIIANLGKVAAATAVDDESGIRLAAADLARRCPSVLRLANPPVAVASRRAALQTAIGLPVAPPRYRDDMLTCLGLCPGPPAEVAAAAHRLVAGIVTLSRPYAGRLVAIAGADLAAALVDGRLDRYLDQLGRSGWDGWAAPRPRTEQSDPVPVPDPPVAGVPAAATPSAAARTPSAAAARPSGLAPAIAARLRRTADGLVAAVVRQHDSGEILMMAWMDDEALHRTLTTGRATYWSRSRQEYWVKGATSGHHQYVRAVALDCDGDTLLVSVEQVGPACHTGSRTCFFDELPVTGDAGSPAAPVPPDRPADQVTERAAGSGGGRP